MKKIFLILVVAGILRNTASAFPMYECSGSAKMELESRISSKYLFDAANDECDTAMTLPVNDALECVSSVSVTFNQATASSVPACTGINGADIWFTFTAEGPAHIITVTNFLITDSSAQPVVLSLYEGECNTLGDALFCSQNNAINAIGLIPGNEYFIRASLNTLSPNLSTGFDICITTPEIGGGNDTCLVTTVNYDFEEPPIGNATLAFINHNAVLGWRTTAPDQVIEFWSSGFQGVMAYSGNQFIELNANVVSGVYQDYISPEGTVFNYGFAHRGRLGVDTCQLYAGPPGGPYIAVGSPVSTGNTGWSYNQGTYVVPPGQPVTRFVFEAISSVGGTSVGNFLDAISFTANTGILTASPLELDCDQPIAEVEAVGAGIWIAHSSNPAPTIIENPNSNTTVISGFTVSGEYYYDWSTPFCINTLVISFSGGDIPDPVVMNVEYCEGNTATPLIAEVLPGYTANWYADSEGEIVLSEAPTPDTDSIGEVTYYVSQSNENGCEGILIPVTVIVHPLLIPIVEFDYDSSYCDDQKSISPMLTSGFTGGGIFSSSEGLVIDQQTGVVDVSESIPGTYTVIYTVTADEENCLEGSSFSDVFTIVGGVNFQLSGSCIGSDYTVFAEPEAGTFVDGMTYTWLVSQGGSVMTDGPTFNLSGFLRNNPGHSFPMQVSLIVGHEECEYISSYWIEGVNCGIPKGISPNNDGLNDTFDLSHLQVNKLSIFNRYGIEVYQKKNYISEWYGQTNKGDELPDGTYYYVVEHDGGNSTGWVYINREK